MARYNPIGTPLDPANWQQWRVVGLDHHGDICTVIVPANSWPNAALTAKSIYRVDAAIGTPIGKTLPTGFLN